LVDLGLKHDCLVPDFPFEDMTPFLYMTYDVHKPDISLGYGHMTCYIEPEFGEDGCAQAGLTFRLWRAPEAYESTETPTDDSNVSPVGYIENEASSTGGRSGRSTRASHFLTGGAEGRGSRGGARGGGRPGALEEDNTEEENTEEENTMQLSDSNEISCLP
jgi:hypothetical protein